MALDKLIVRGARAQSEECRPRNPLRQVGGHHRPQRQRQSSLAFDTIYAEGQRRYVESLSAYARQFLGLMEKPNVDQIEGLSPAISIDQKGAGRNPRSTVGTVTEIYDYLRLLYARIGQPHCPVCGEPIAQQSATQIVDSIMDMPEATRLLILAPIVKDRKGIHKSVFETLQRQGYVRVRVNGEIYEVSEPPELDRYKMHTIEAVIDRLVVRHPRPSEDGDAEPAPGTDLTRLSDSVETALRLGEGVMIAVDVTDPDAPRDRTFSEHFSCVKCGASLPEIEPRTFSNSPHGACPTCTGLGSLQEFDPDLILDEERSIQDGAVRPWRRSNGDDQDGYYQQILFALCRQYAIPYRAGARCSVPNSATILNGLPRADKIRIEYRSTGGETRYYETGYSGVIPNLQKRLRETTSDYVRNKLEEYMSVRPCPTCGGKRLRPEALAVTVAGRNIDEITSMAVDDALQWVRQLQGLPQEVALADVAALNGRAESSANGRTPNGDLDAPPLSPREVHLLSGARRDRRPPPVHGQRWAGLSHASRAATLSGGEAQRIRLATQIGSQPMGVLYILDEPSIGLHQRDNARLIETLMGMRDLGTTVPSSNTTRTPSAPLTGSWTWGRARASMAARSSAPRPETNSALSRQPHSRLSARRAAHRDPARTPRGQRQLPADPRRRRE